MIIDMYIYDIIYENIWYSEVLIYIMAIYTHIDI